MTILTHAQKDQVKNGLAFSVKRCDPANLGLGLLGGKFGRFLAANPVDALRWDGERLEETFLGRTETALDIRWRHTSLIRPKELHVRE